MKLTRQINMKNFSVFVLVLLVCGALFTPVLAQNRSDGRATPEPAINYYSGVERYLVTWMHSRIDDQISSATVVAVTNRHYP